MTPLPWLVTTPMNDDTGDDGKEEMQVHRNQDKKLGRVME